MYLRTATLPLPLLVLLAACATSPRMTATPEAPSTLDVPLFSVARPAGDWNINIDSAQSRIELARTSAWQGVSVQFTRLSVFANAVVAGSGMQTEKKIAEDFLDNEVRVMNEAAAAGQFDLEIVTRWSASIGGRNVHALRYEKNLDGLAGMLGMSEQAVLYLWFPPDFSGSQRFYGFRVSETFKRGSLGVRVNLAQIEPVVASLRPRTPVITVEQ